MAMKVGTVVKKNRRCKATRTNDLDSSSIDLDIPASAREVRYQERGRVQGLYLIPISSINRSKLKLCTYLWDASLTSFLPDSYAYVGVLLSTLFIFLFFYCFVSLSLLLSCCEV